MLLQNKLDFYGAVLDLRAAVGGLNIIRSLHQLSNREWERCRNDASDVHLIKGVIFDSTKTDAIRAYIAKIVKLYMNSVGTVVGTWTKHGLEQEHLLTKAVSDKITTSEINTADQLFEMVGTKLLGIDVYLVRAGMAESTEDVAKALVTYLGYRADETSDPLATYPELTKVLGDLLSQNLVDDVFYDVVLTEGTIILGENEDQLVGIEVLESAALRAAADGKLG